MKILCSMLMLFLLSVSCYSQSAGTDQYNVPKERSGWGVKIGMNIANIEENDSEGEEYDPKNGFVIGVFKTIPINQSAQFQWEILYSSKGASYEFEDSYYDTYTILEEEGSMDLNFNYLEIPLSVRFLIPAGSGITPSVYAGGSIGFNISAVMSYDYEFYYLYDDGYNYYEESDTVSDTEKIDDASEVETALIFGGGITFPLRDGSLVFDVRYSHGLSSIINEEDLNVYNRVWSLTAGYGF